MSIELMCRKIGMTRLFTESGEAIPVTVLEAGPNVVVQIKSSAGKDGYDAVQLGFGERREKLFDKARRGHFARAGLAPRRHLKESRISAEEAAAFQVGAEVKVDVFAPGQLVDAIGTSKGRGFAGVVKRHGFPVHKMSHGTHEYFRHPGSIGAGTYPGHIWKGSRMAGHAGDARVTIRNIEVVRVDPEQNLLFVKGAVPGHKNGIVRIRKAVSGGEK